jgi:hypothetical protein
MMVTLTVPESQIVEWVQQLTPTAKQTVLRALIPTLDDYEALVTYGSERARAVAARHGLNWDNLDEHQREQLIDGILHPK